MENESLGLLVCGKGKLHILREQVETMLRSVGFDHIAYATPAITPLAAHPYSCQEIRLDGSVCGIIYKLRPGILKTDAYFAELDIDQLAAINVKAVNPVVELVDKLVVWI